jgi:hypothetical protein
VIYEELAGIVETAIQTLHETISSLPLDLALKDRLSGMSRAAFW